MLINFELSDITDLVEDQWCSSDLEEDENFYYVFSCHSDTALFLIKKIITTFQYEIVSTYDMTNGDIAYITNIKYSDLMLVCPDCEGVLCNRCSPDVSEPEQELDNDRRWN